MPFIICADAACASPQALKAQGYTHVRVNAVWALNELSEGRLDIPDIHELLMQAEACGMSVILRVDLRSMPPWLGDKFPEASGRKSGICPFYPGVMSDTLYYVRTLVRELAKYDVISHWDLEAPGYARDCGYGCDADNAAFRDHLRETYGTIKALNDAFGVNYTDFSGVYPVNDALKAAFLHYQSTAPAIRLAELAWAVSECDSKAREVLYMTPSLTPEGALHPWDDAPSEGVRRAEFMHMLETMDRKRSLASADKPLLAELCFPRGFMDHYVPTIEDASRAFAAAALGGAEGVVVGEGANEAVLSVCAALGKRMSDAEPPESARTLIVSHSPADALTRYAERAYYALFTQEGVTADFGCAVTDAHGVVVWPACEALDVGMVKEALEKGKHVIIEALPPLLDDRALCALLGVTPGASRLVGEPGTPRFMPPSTFSDGRLPHSMLRGAGELEGDTLRASLYCAPLACAEGTHPLFTLGNQPVVVTRDIGGARAILAATCLCYPMKAHGDPLSRAALRGIMGLIGMKGAPSDAITRKRGALELNYDMRDEALTINTIR